MTLLFFCFLIPQLAGVCLALRLSRFAREERLPRPGRIPHEFLDGTWGAS